MINDENILTAEGRKEIEAFVQNKEIPEDMVTAALQEEINKKTPAKFIASKVIANLARKINKPAKGIGIIKIGYSQKNVTNQTPPKEVQSGHFIVCLLDGKVLEATCTAWGEGEVSVMESIPLNVVGEILVNYTNSKKAGILELKIDSNAMFVPTPNATWMRGDAQERLNKISELYAPTLISELTPSKLDNKGYPEKSDIKSVEGIIDHIVMKSSNKGKAYAEVYITDSSLNAKHSTPLKVYMDASLIINLDAGENSEVKVCGTTSLNATTNELVMNGVMLFPIKTVSYISQVTSPQTFSGDSRDSGVGVDTSARNLADRFC